MTRADAVTAAARELRALKFWRDEFAVPVIRAFGRIAPKDPELAKARLTAVVDDVLARHAEWPSVKELIDTYARLFGRLGDEQEIDEAVWLWNSAQEEERVLGPRLVESRPELSQEQVVERIRRRAFRLRMARPACLSDPLWQEFYATDEPDELERILKAIKQRVAA